MLAQQLCDRQRDDSQKMPRLHFNDAFAFSADASPEHANEDAEQRERRDVEVRQQQRRVALQQLQSHPGGSAATAEPTHVPDHNLDLLNLATEQHAAVIEADEKGKKAEELRKTEAAAAMAYTLAAVVSAQARMDAQAASAGAGAAGGLPPHLSPHP